MSVVRPFSVLSKDKLVLSKTGGFLSKAEILGVGVFSSLSNFWCWNSTLRSLSTLETVEEISPQNPWTHEFQDKKRPQLGPRKRKAHKLFHINFLCRPSSPGLSQGWPRVCPRDKPGFAGLPLCKIRTKPGFVPGTNRVCPRDKPGENPRPTWQKSLCLCAFFLPEI